MDDTVEVKLPVSGGIVVLRNYTTRNDDEQANVALYRGVDAKPTVSKDGMKSANVVFPVANMMESTNVYVRRLVVSINGETHNIQGQLGELKTKDYEAIETAVDKIIADNSPKVKGA